MAVINTNVNAIIARNAGAVNDRSMTNAMQQLSTGKRINVAADDAAGLAISTKMTSQIRGLDQAVRNANDGISMLQVVEGATVEMTNMLQRMRELAVQSANDTNTSTERSYLNDEFVQLQEEINRIATTTQWNGKNVMDGSEGVGSAIVSGNGGRSVSFQVGANQNQTIDFDIANFAQNATADVETLSFTAAVAAAEATTAAVQFASIEISGASATTAVTLGTTSMIENGTQADWEALATEMETAIRNAALTSSDSGIASYANIEIYATGVGELKLVNPSGSDISDITFGVTGAGTTPADIATVSVTAGEEDADSALSVFKTAGLNGLAITTQSEANTAVSSLDTALGALNQQRSAIGATINRLTYAADNLTNTSANVNAARSRVLDTDYAQATTELARTQIIQQASTAMLAQANQGAQSVLSLLK